jgi:putative ATPase
VDEGLESFISSACGGDVRKAINAVEILYTTAKKTEDAVHLSLADAEIAAQKSAMRYDRGGDAHYDILSALQKSIRGSDPDAAVHYLARLLEAGDLSSACRRILVIAAEDIGLAHPQAIAITKACVDSAMQLGMPEARIPLANAVILLATAPKSNSAYVAVNKALGDIKTGKSGGIPRHLQNVHADTSGQEREQGYIYPHDYPGHFNIQQYLPDELVGTVYYEYGDNRLEQTAKSYWEQIKGEP